MYERLSESEDDPHNDVILEHGHMGTDFPNVPSSLQGRHPMAWQINHLEAAIYLQEGENNVKFKAHPKSHGAYPAYQIAHNTWLYLLDLFAAVLVLLLAAFERPAVDAIQLPVGIHGSLEIFGLLLLGLDLGIRMKWLGVREFIKHPRTVIKTVVLSIMLGEAVVVIVRQMNHFRVTRALRPIFLLNTHYCRGVRRISRQILQSLPPILDLLFLLLFIMVIFSLLGYFLFSPIKNYQDFETIQASFVSLFVLLTTANYPDVMMPAYHNNRFFALFFILYLAIELYFIMNLFLAVVYDTFSGLEKNKLKKLFYHKREACRHAFRLMVTQKDSEHINLRSFLGTVAHFRPSLTRLEGYLMFKALNTSKTGRLCLDEMYRLYDVCDLKWHRMGEEQEIWSSHFRPPLNRMFRSLYWFANWKLFEYFIYCVIIANFFAIFAETVKISMTGSSVNQHDALSDTSVVFVLIYCVEVIIKVLGKGPGDYFHNSWDQFDFLITVICLASVVAEAFADNFYYVIILRPLRLLRLFKIKRRYRDVLGTLFMLMNKLSSLIVVIILVYYFFAIIGMEMFHNVDLRNCCKNTSVESYYSTANNTFGYYYMNNFDNIFVSGVTLFELTVVNNWYVIMDGYASGFSEWTRLFFMIFYVVMMVVMTIVVALILELFLFRINYRRKMRLHAIEDHEKYQTEVEVSEQENQMCDNPDRLMTGTYIEEQAGNPTIPIPYRYKGERFRNKDDYSLRMYSDEVTQWLEEEKTRETTIHDLEELRVMRRHTANSSIV